MANYDTLKAIINAYITDNGHGDITGPVLNAVLNEMVDILGGSLVTGFLAYDSIADLPAVGEKYVGYLVDGHLYLYVGTGGDTKWGTYQDCGEFKGEEGVGFASVSTNQDGTFIITLTDGNTITVDLNHDHTAYPKYQRCATEADYNALGTHDNNTLYLIPESS